MKGTKANPLGIDKLKKYLAFKEGKPLYKKVYIYPLQAYKRKKYIKLSHLYVLLEGVTYKISGSQTAKGGITQVSLVDPEGVLPRIKVPDTTDFEEIYFKRYLSLEDFETPLEYCGKYHYCEGGGWYSHRQIYKVDDKYYANLIP